ncbi:MAG: Fe-Mn family superoxide dismutase [bacterium]|nr:Fe-Mn family superoxide dismutase [bacterium]
MKKFEEKKFNIPALKGISAKNIEEHLKLYAGYVKNANLIMEHMSEFAQNSEKYAYELAELQRRFAFEWGGMRNHEIYFSALEGGAKKILDGELKRAIESQMTPFETFLERFKMIAMTRGVGWAMLFYDRKNGALHTQWVDEQHIGHLTDCSIVLALDMWEHAYVYDYPTSEKKKYVEAFFENLNWEVIEENFTKAR